jgi:hypothetical protein
MMLGALRAQASKLRNVSYLHNLTYLSYPPDVLIPGLLVEAEVLVQTKAHIVAIETVCGVSKVQKMLLERGCDRGLSRRRKTSEPECEALLLAEPVALSAGKRRVPCDVAEVQC